MRGAKYDELQNPGVPTTIIYTNNEKTALKLFYDNDPKLSTSIDSGQPAKATQKEFNLGDGSILSTSDLAPGIKWADEFKRSHPNSFPVTFAEICSHKNQRSSVQVDGVDPSDNNYHSIRCDCESTPASCGHTALATDSASSTIWPRRSAASSPIVSVIVKERAMLAVSRDACCSWLCECMPRHELTVALCVIVSCG